MTLIASWWSTNAVCMVVDCAITHPGPGRSETSVFGEASHINDDGSRVNDGANKLTQLSEKCLISVSGDVNSARDFIKHFSAHQGIRDISSALRQSMEGVFGTTAPPRFVLHIARALEKELQLVRFDSSAPSDCQVSQGEGFVDGSVPDLLRVGITNHISGFQGHPNRHTRREISACIGYLQWIGQRNRLFEHGIGGAFWGGWIDPVQIHWAPDVLYSVDLPIDEMQATALTDGDTEYDGSPPSSAFTVRLLVRDGVLMMHSTLDAQAALVSFPMLADLRFMKSWHKAYDSNIRDFISGTNNDCIFGLIGKHAIVMFDNKKYAGLFVSVQELPNGQKAFALSSEVTRVLAEPYEDGSVIWFEPVTMKVAEVFGVKGLADRHIRVTCPKCRHERSLAKAHRTSESQGMVYRCPQDEEILVILSPAIPDARPWPGRGYRMGDFVIRNPVDLRVCVPNARGIVLFPASPAALSTSPP